MKLLQNFDFCHCVTKKIQKDLVIRSPKMSQYYVNAEQHSLTLRKTGLNYYKKFKNIQDEKKVGRNKLILTKEGKYYIQK